MKILVCICDTSMRWELRGTKKMVSPVISVHAQYLQSCFLLTNDDLAFLGEIIFGNLEVERSGTFSYATRDIVVGTVARTEPTAKVTSLADGYTTQVGAHAWGELAVSRDEKGMHRTKHDQPFGLLYTVAVGLRISQTFPFSILGFLDLICCAVTDEDGLATPLDDDLNHSQYIFPLYS